MKTLATPALNKAFANGFPLDGILSLRQIEALLEWEEIMRMRPKNESDEGVFTSLDDRLGAAGN